MTNGLAALFQDHLQFEEVYIASTGAKAIAVLEQTPPDLVVLDLSLGTDSGLDVADRLYHQYPYVKYIAFTMHEDLTMIRELVNRGAHGYLLKTSPPEEILRASLSVLNGALYFRGRIADLLKASKQTQDENIPKISPREGEILRLIMQEYTMPQIAETLYISIHTVISHRKNLIRKLKVKNTAGLVLKAAELGM